VPRTLDDLFADAARRICRYTPAEAHASVAAILDIRSQEARERERSGVMES
jgi:hypothetical protein